MDAEDVVQDVFEKLWKKREKVDFDRCKSLLFKMTHNRIIDIYRYNKVRRNENHIVEKVEESIERNFELTEIIELAFKELSEEYKSLVMLRDYEGFSYDEIAEMLDMSLCKVKVYLFRARKQLQKTIKSLEFAE
jgi:RNA polymerase sigma-70 factor (ECF subfamily)